MKPVHLLSTEDATQELEQLLDARPTEDPVALHHWNQDHGPRAAELQTWLLMHPQDAPPQQLHIEESPMETSDLTPQEQLVALLAQLGTATQDCTAAVDRGGYLKSRSLIYQCRAAIKRLVATAGLEAPSLPDIPANPYAWQPETGEASLEPESTSESATETDTEGEESDDSDLGAIAAQHGEALRALGELMQQYPGEIDAALGMRLGFLLDILGNSLCLAGEGAA